MPASLERKAEGYARHLGARKGTKQYDKIKYGTMRAAGWKPGQGKKVLGQNGK